MYYTYLREIKYLVVIKHMKGVRLERLGDCQTQGSWIIKRNLALLKLIWKSENRCSNWLYVIWYYSLLSQLGLRHATQQSNLLFRVFCLYGLWCFGEYCNEQCLGLCMLVACVPHVEAHATVCCASINEALLWFVTSTPPTHDQNKQLYLAV